jgi:hypothetical protein
LPGNWDENRRKYNPAQNIVWKADRVFEHRVTLVRENQTERKESLPVPIVITLDVFDIAPPTIRGEQSSP